MDVLAGFDFLEVASLSPNPGQLYADARTLYALYQDAKKNGLSVANMLKQGTFKSEVGALARVSAFVYKTLEDPKHGPQLEAFLSSIGT